MYEFKVTFANHIILVKTIHVRPQRICRDFFESCGEPDLFVCTDQADIDFEKTQIDHKEDREPWAGFLEVYALHRKISTEIITKDVVVIHSAVIAVNKNAYLFTAPSGTGKTTHIMKWLENCPDAFVVNGDKPFIKINDDGSVLACGSPWAGKENMYTNTMVPLKAIVLMERAEENRIEQISFAQAFPTLLQQVYRPDDEEKMRKILRLMQRLSPAVSFWRFQCNNFKDDCFDVAYNALVGKQP